MKDWLRSDSTGDGLHDMLVVQILLSRALTGTLQMNKRRLQDLTLMMDANNALIEKLRGYIPTTDSKGDPANDTTPVNLGASAEDSESIIKQLQAAGININEADINKTASPWTVTKNKMDQWMLGLQNRNQTLSSQASQQQADVQQQLGRYNQAVETASSLIKKRGDLGDSIAGNSRG